MWVTLHANGIPELDGQEIYLPASLHTPAETGFHVINSAGIPPGTYWIHCEVTDGGSTAGGWSPGTVTFVEPDFFIRGDCDGDGSVGGQVTDAVVLLRYNFLGAEEPPCLAACDADGDGAIRGTVVDAVYLLRHGFLGGPPPPSPFSFCGPGLLPGDRALGCEEPPESCSGHSD
jgi:hypothetical protein